VVQLSDGVLAKLAVSRLQTILQTFQLRRTKESMLDGKKLIELPEKKIDITALHFSQEEADIYKMVRLSVSRPVYTH
jgi:SNF2 family DNA or RNA helicase